MSLVLKAHMLHPDTSTQQKVCENVESRDKRCQVQDAGVLAGKEQAADGSSIAQEDLRGGGGDTFSVITAGQRLWNSTWLSFHPLMPLDLRGLAAFRFGLGLTIAYEVCGLLYWQKAFLSDQGVCTRPRLLAEVVNMNPGPAFQLYFAVGDSISITVLLLMNFIAACAMAVGYRTKTSIFVCWFMRQGLRHRILYMGYSADGLICALLFWALCLPVGERYSVDRVLMHGSSREKPTMGPKITCLILLELVMMYGMAGYYKTGNLWTNNEAISKVVSGNIFKPGPFREFLASSPKLCAALTKATMLSEKFGWILFVLPHWIPRLMACMLFLGFHISLWVVMQLECFQPAAAAAVLACLPAVIWDRVEAKVASLPNPKKAVNCNVDKSTAHCTKRLQHSWRHQILGVVKVCGCIVPCVLMFATMRLSCNELSNRRPAAEGFQMPLFCKPVLLAGHTLGRISEQPGVPILGRALASLDQTVRFIGTEQAFDMFSENPPVEYWWIRITGHTTNGTAVNLWADGAPCLDTPGYGCDRFPLPWATRPEVPFVNHRWLKVFEHSVVQRVCPQDITTYFCSEWNMHNAGELQLSHFRVVKLWYKAVPPAENKDDAPNGTVISRHACMPNHLRLAEHLDEPREYSTQEICDHDRAIAAFSRANETLLSACNSGYMPPPSLASLGISLN